jgi:hypothetical protein
MTKEVKMCTQCSETKSLGCFNKHKRDGYRYDCKECASKSTKKYHQDNPEYNKKQYQKNKNARAEYNRKYRQNNRDAMIEYTRKWKQENKGAINAGKAKRRAHKRNSTPEWLTEEQDNKIKMYYKIAKALEKMDGVKRHVDHIVPLKGKGVRGLHVPWNLQILTAEANLSKNNSYSDW